MVITFPCSICTKTVDDNDISIYCDKCNLWVHIKCNNLHFLDYQYLNGNDDSWFCLKCNTELLPFGNLNNETFNQYINSSNTQNKYIDQDKSSNLVSQIHDFKDHENVVNCKYCNLEVQPMKIPNKKNSLYFILTHALYLKTLTILNICSKQLISIST